jgi:hypothetical protein
VLALAADWTLARLGDVLRRDVRLNAR